MLLTFKVNKQLIKRTDCEIPVAKSENYLYAQFTFSDEWVGTKTAIFNNGTPYSVILDEDNKCLVPWEVITASGFSVSVFCGQRITANVEFVGVLPTGYIEGQTPTPPTPTVYEQIIEELNGKLEPENIIAGDNITITVNGKNVTISSTGGSSVQVDEVTLTDDNGTLKVKSGGIGSAQLSTALMSLINGKANQLRTLYTPQTSSVRAENIADGFYEASADFTLIVGYGVSSQTDLTVNTGDLFYVKQGVVSPYCIGFVIGENINVFTYNDSDDGVLAAAFTDMVDFAYQTMLTLEDWATSKQDTLTAGAGISISEQNVISATGGITFEVVQALPSTGDTQTIYLVPNSGSAPNVYDEYIYVNNAWEKIGTTEVDLSNYYTKTETNTLLGGKVDTSAIKQTTGSSTTDLMSQKAVTNALSGKANNPLVFSNITVATSDWESDSTYADYPYKAVITCQGVTSSMTADVYFSGASAALGTLFSYCAEGTNSVTIFCSANDTAVTIDKIEVR